MLSAASINAVRDATVIIVNPTHLANALRYDPDHDDAPILLSKGEGELAAKIIQAAQDYGVPVIQDIPLARALYELSEGNGIPPELYEAVAAILQEIWDADPSLAPK
jgi:type III secretion protein U